MLRNLRNFNAHLRDLIEEAKRRKKKTTDDDSERDDGANELTGFLDIPKGAIEGFFSGTEGEGPSGASVSSGRPGSVSLGMVLTGQASPAQYVLAVGAQVAMSTARDAILGHAFGGGSQINAIAKRLGISASQVRQILQQILSLASGQLGGGG